MIHDTCATTNILKGMNAAVPSHRKINRVLFTSKKLHHATTMAGSVLRKRQRHL